MKKIIVLIVVLLVLPFQSDFTIKPASLSSSTTTISVRPQETKTLPCRNFTINITVTDVETDFEMFRISLTYNTTIIDFVEAKDGGDFCFDPRYFNVTADDIAGKLLMSGSRPSKHPTSGAMVTITFHCTGLGESDLTLYKDLLRKSDGGDISHVLVSGKCIQENTITYEIEICENFTLCTDLYFLGQRLFLVNASNIVFDFQGHSIISQGSRGTAIEVGSIKSELSNVTIKGGNLSRFQYGVRVRNCNNVGIIDLNVESIDSRGIEVVNSKNVTIINAHVEDSDSMGIEVINSKNVTIMNSKVAAAQAEGIYLDGNSNVTICGSEILDNTHDGVAVKKSSNCTIIYNNTISNNEVGVYLEDSYDNICLYNNNFLKNSEKHAKCSNTRANWNLEYPCGGNYWDDYGIHSIRDVASGKNLTIARIPGPDGIGDDAYPVDDGHINQDLYPLMNPYNETLRLFDSTCRICEPIPGGEIEKTKTLVFSVFSNGYVTDFCFNTTEKRAHFKVSSSTFCRVIACKELLRGALRVSIDGTLTPSILIWDETHLFDDFTLSNETHDVVVEGEIAAKLICDITGNIKYVPDGIVDIRDITLVAINFLWKSEGP